MDPKEIRSEILRLTAEYSRKCHASNLPSNDPSKPEWFPGDPIPYAARVFDSAEVEAAVGTTLDFWLTLGEQGDKFQQSLSSYLGVRSSLLVNSRSTQTFSNISTYVTQDCKRQTFNAWQ